MKKIGWLLLGGMMAFLPQGSVFASSATTAEIKKLESCLGSCIEECGTSLKCIGNCGKTCAEYAFNHSIENLDRCEDLLVPVVSYAVEKAAEKAGCKGIVLAFEASCSAVTAVKGAPECTVGSAVIGANCGFHGNAYAKDNAKNIARDVCDYVFPDSDPYILIENHLENAEHQVDFSAIIDKGDNVHVRGNNWLPAGETGILASHKLKGGDFHGIVEARVKRDGKSDIDLKTSEVKANHHLVYAYYKDGDYHLGKKEVHISPIIGIENHLQSKEIDFRAVINGSPDVHLPGDNWLKPGGKALLGSYKLFGNKYTVEARVKEAGEGDKTLTIHHITPGQDSVYVYYKDGRYHIAKKALN